MSPWGKGSHALGEQGCQMEWFFLLRAMDKTQFRPSDWLEEREEHVESFNGSLPTTGLSYGGGLFHRNTLPPLRNMGKRSRNLFQNPFLLSCQFLLLCF